MRMNKNDGTHKSISDTFIMIESGNTQQFYLY